ncbi:MAG TPA: EamA family transporter [Ignavibacteria bacterium]|nr:EamA family transporter [Ignavibacteria bacterium]
MDWYILALFSALLSAVAAILQKKVLFNISALRFSLIVSGFIAILSTFLINFSSFNSLNLLSFSILLFKSIINAAAFLCIMTALKNLEISRTLPVLAASPMLIALLAFIFMGESLKPVEVFGMFFIVAGTFILELNVNENIFYPLKTFVKSKYHRIVLLALLLISISSVLDKLLLTNFKLPPLTFLVIQNFFFLLTFTIFWMINRSKPGNEMLFSGIKFSSLILIFIIAVFTIGYRWLQFESVKIAPVGLVISIKRLSVLFAVVLGAKIFKEANYFRKVIAATLIVTGALMIYED